MTPQDLSDLITGADLASRVGEPYTTIDYWSKMGLLEFQRRGNRRLYEPIVCEERCGAIRRLQNDGLNLVAIRQELERTADRRRRWTYGRISDRE